ncbi:hypothetical protein D3C78_1772350 [compost metagenome]
MHLRLASEATEGAGKDDAVVVLVERTAAQLLRTVQRFSEAFASQQGMPIQGRLLRLMMSMP